MMALILSISGREGLFHGISQGEIGKKEDGAQLFIAHNILLISGKK